MPQQKSTRKRSRIKVEKTLTAGQLQQIIRSQANEMTEYVVYSHLAKATDDAHNKQILNKIALQEKKHAEIWATFTKTTLKANQWRAFIYRLIAQLLGFTFTIKLLEKNEEAAQVNYQEIGKVIPVALEIEKEENEHEEELIAMLDEERLRYVSSMVLGLNDALVELTGTLAGLTLALQNHALVAISGLITGIAASLSMAASEYLSVKSGEEGKDPLKSAVYTGMMYSLTVLVLIAPYFILDNVFLSLAWALSNAVLIIFAFTYYVSVVQEINFKRRFLEMAGLSLGVSALTFCIGLLVRTFLKVEL